MSENYIRELFLEREKSTLSPYAFLTLRTKGREHPYIPCPVRTEFQRDRDRIIHSTSFRRLMHKTQVFLMPLDDHYRTRLTHTLEVSQIARIISRGLRLNEDLTEAIALGHDLGHTPFGHAGEDAMRTCYDPDFAHYKQSLRVVEKLEGNGSGLNLTFEVRDGIVNHTGKNMASTLEGVVVKFADRIAYINHDIDDAVRAGILRQDDIPTELRRVLGDGHSERINRMVLSVITSSADKPAITMTDEIQQATDALRSFMFEHVYEDKVAKREDAKAKALLISLYEYFCRNPEKMPKEYLMNAEEEGIERCACDYVAGMTDRYAIELYNELYVPRVWGGK